MKHDKGPWQYMKEVGIVFVEKECEVGYGPAPICHMTTPQNAELITAAPDLFAALERIVAVLYNNADDSIAAAEDQAMDALAKARGE
jgi:hypothetical protein